MNWNALKDGRCPKCGKMLYQNADARMLTCSNRSCAFRISEEKLAKIISKPARSAQPRGDGWERFDS